MTIARSTLAARTPLVASQRATRLFWILVAGAAGMTALLALLPAAGHDQLWFLLLARRWLHGAALYGPEAFDSNPPMVIWLSAGPVAVGSLTHVPATTWAKLLVLLLCGGSALLCARLLPLAWRRLRAYEVPALLFACTVLFGVVPARDFGQREHLVGLLLLPYVLAAGVHRRVHALPVMRLAAGCMAGIALCLKPHHILVPVVIEAALLLFPAALFRSELPQPLATTTGTPPTTPELSMPSARSSTSAAWTMRRAHLLRPEPLLILGIGFGYLLAIRAFAPLYLSRAIPITRSVYWAIGHLSFPQLLFQAVELCVLAATAAGLLLRPGTASPAVRLLLLGGTAASAAYFLQGTGWYYQQLPAISFFGAALALQLLDRGAPSVLTMPAWLPTAAGALVQLALALTLHFTGYPVTQDRAFAMDSPDPGLFRDFPAGTPVAILTTSVDEAMMPVERFHLTWAQRTNNLWLLPAILRSERPEGASARKPLAPGEVASLDALQHRWMVEDLQRWQPRLVLVERCQDDAVRCQVLEDRHDDLLAWFERDPAFQAIWKQYSFVRTDGRFNIYESK